MPRLWMVDPTQLCRKHLLAEHHECHVFLGKLKAQHKLDGYISANLFSLSDLWYRHEALANELNRRGYQHATPFPPRASVMLHGAYLAPHGLVDREAAEADLRSRQCTCFHGVDSLD